MSDLAINAALSLRLQALGLPAYFENQAGFVPTPGELYLAEAYMPAPTVPIGMEDTSSNDFKGIYQVTVMAPRDTYKLGGFTAAKQVIAHFKRGTILLGDGVSVRCENAIQHQGSPAGDRWQIPISVWYRSLCK